MAAKTEDPKLKSEKDDDKDELAALDTLEKEASEFNKVRILPHSLLLPRLMLIACRTQKSTAF